VSPNRHHPAGGGDWGTPTKTPRSARPQHGSDRGRQPHRPCHPPALAAAVFSLHVSFPYSPSHSIDRALPALPVSAAPVPLEDTFVLSMVSVDFLGPRSCGASSRSRPASNPSGLRSSFTCDRCGARAPVGFSRFGEAHSDFMAEPRFFLFVASGDVQVVVSQKEIGATGASCPAQARERHPAAPGSFGFGMWG
jgi:hypothetical protein